MLKRNSELKKYILYEKYILFLFSDKLKLQIHTKYFLHKYSWVFVVLSQVA